MLKISVPLLVSFVLLIYSTIAIATTPATIFSTPYSSYSSSTFTTSSPTDECLQNSLDFSFWLCRGSRALRNVLHNLSKSDRPLVIVRGLEIVPSKEVEQEKTFASTSSARSDNESAMTADATVLERFSYYLRTHELNIKFADLLAEESERYLTGARDLEQNGVKAAGDGFVEEARKKDKGQGVMLIMALMFGKLLAVMGLGGIGAMAMKALGVAMAALMMSGMLGLKSLSQQGHETSSVQYVNADGGHHHKRRRRRNAGGQPLAYSGWSGLIRRSI